MNLTVIISSLIKIFLFLNKYMALGNKKNEHVVVKPMYKVTGVLIVVLISLILIAHFMNDDSGNNELNGKLTGELNESSLKSGDAKDTKSSSPSGTAGEKQKVNNTRNITGENNSGNGKIIPENLNETPEPESEISEIQDSSYAGKISDLLKAIRTYNESIFDMYDVTQDETEIERLTSMVNEKCRDNETQELKVSCAIITVVWNSKKSEACDFSCLPSFCEIYKMHAAVYVLNQMLPDKQIFIAMDTKGQMYVLYKGAGRWMTYGVNPMNIDLNNTIILYNDKYSTENKFDLIEPRYVNQGGKFCFEVYVNESCACRIEQSELNVGTCPQLSTKMFLTLCEKPIELFDLLPGNNKFCFDVPKDYEKGLYTYSFTFVSDKKYLGVGNSIIEVSRHNCCIEGTELRGFVVVK